MPWYSGPTLLEVLEKRGCDSASVNISRCGFPVQYVNRPNLDFRGYAGTLSAGVVRVGQRIKVLPSGVESTVARIVTFDGDLQEAGPGEAITLVLKDEVDISRAEPAGGCQRNPAGHAKRLGGRGMDGRTAAVAGPKLRHQDSREENSCPR
ncbi:Sulfate adenylyltransferase subunit 1 [Serratia fonticola]|uniref:Sulfate adenylyltransferase subunit 1 n=1 Tax=Serratia fonticola TaxID=47917 RepID=A0A4U9WGF3_SERFO|nr:Sulfate adenylyltransferase subunit 1 [Serratia fonticola]